MTRARRWLAPEVVQTSAMDCGPAALKCLLEGYGVRVSYDRLREACQTDVDGTTIDTLEEIAVSLGLEAEQVLLPADHLLMSSARTLPCIALVRLPSGEAHFVVVWRRIGPLVEVMDPAVGRRWETLQGLQNELYEHEMPVPAAEWRAWATSEGFLGPLDQHLSELGLSSPARAKLIATAVEDPTWRGLGTLDAVTRLAGALWRGGALRSGDDAGRLINALVGADQSRAAGALLEPHRHVRALPGTEGGEQLLIRGAVIIRCTGISTEPVDVAGLPTELATALAQPTVRPLHALWRLMRADGWAIPAAVLLASVTAAAALALEGLLFFSFLNVGERLVLVEQRVAATAVVLALLACALLMDGSLAKLLWRSGRHLELRMRAALLEKIPTLSDRHFRSRLVSDMAERAHRTYALRELPDLAGQGLRTLLELAFTAAAIVWIDSRAAVWAFAALALAIALPVAALPLLQSRDLKWRTHGGALSRFHLDALLGMMPIRSHGAGDAFRRAHEGLLVEWARAGFALQRWSTAVDVGHWLIGLSLLAWLISAYRGVQDFPAALLLLYWSLKIPLLGHELIIHARRYPGLHNATLRLLEPLGTVDVAPVADGADAPDPVVSEPVATQPATDNEPTWGGAAGVSLQLENVDVQAAGHEVLHGISLQIAAGEHLAVVGASGAGKSALLGLMLGWYRPAGGTLLADGRELDDAALGRLRLDTAWVDPTVQLWNRSLYANLCYGTQADPASIHSSLTAAGLKEVLQRLAEGMQTSLGEGGTLLSGGEGQRVRIGRALIRENSRLVLLDEPFRGLARDERSRLLAHARARWPDATLLFVTHDIADAQHFDRVLVMHDGRVVEDDVPYVLAGTPDSRYAALLSLDAEAQAQWSDSAWRRLWLEDGRLSEKCALP